MISLFHKGFFLESEIDLNRFTNVIINFGRLLKLNQNICIERKNIKFVKDLGKK